MSGPSIVPIGKGTLGYKARILAVLEAAGSSGATAADVACKIGHDAKVVVVLLGQYRTAGLVWSERTGVVVRFFAAAVAAPPAGCVAPTPAARKRALAKAAATRVNVFCEQPSNGPSMPQSGREVHGVRVVEGGVLITRCRPMVDTRYVVDASSFKGGEFTAEWRRLRGRGAQR